VTTVAEVPRSLAQVRVLVADDDADIREALFEMLGEQGFTMVGAAEDGVQAVSLAKDLEPDVILMDLRMPGLDGIEATREITSRQPQVKVVMLSAYDDPALSSSATEHGAYCYLVKGCPPKLIGDVLVQAWSHGQT
jgi:DNA-binding NarL/FixJ family response regulator